MSRARFMKPAKLLKVIRMSIDSFHFDVET